MAKSLRCSETTHCCNAPLHLKVLHIVKVQPQEYGILTSMVEEMWSLIYFLNCQCIHAPLFHVMLAYVFHFQYYHSNQ